MKLALLLAVLAAPEPLTLQQAASLAAGGAPTVERARAETDRARASESSARSALGPTLFGDVGFLTSNNPVTVFSLALEQQRFSAQEFFLSDPNDPPFTKDWSAAVAAAWSVDIFGSARAAARAAGSAAEAAERAARRTGDGAALQAIAAFVEARRAEDTLAILAEREADAERDEALARALYEEGIATSADPARALAVAAEVRAEAAAFRAAGVDRARGAGRLIGEEAAARPLAPLAGAVARAPRRLPARATTSPRPSSPLEAARQAARSADASRWPSLVVTGRYEFHSPTAGRPVRRLRHGLRRIPGPDLRFRAPCRRAWPRRGRRRGRPRPRSRSAGARRRARSLSARARAEAAAARLAAFEEARTAAGRARRDPAGAIRGGRRAPLGPARGPRRRSCARAWARWARRPTGCSPRRTCAWPWAWRPEGEGAR